MTLATVKAHLQGKELVVGEIYEKLVAACNKFGKVKVEAHRTSIHLIRKTAFAGVATRKSYIVLTIKSAVSIENERILRAEQTSANRYHLEVKLVSPDEIDQELVGWLRKGWELSG